MWHAIKHQRIKHQSKNQACDQTSIKHKSNNKHQSVKHQSNNEAYNYHQSNIQAKIRETTIKQAYNQSNIQSNINQASFNQSSIHPNINQASIKHQSIKIQSKFSQASVK